MNNVKLEELLIETGLPETARIILIDQLVDGVGELQLMTKVIGEKGESVAIKDDDFPILKEAAVIAAAFATAASVVAWAPAAIASLVVLLYLYRKNGIRLSALQGALLRELKRRPMGMSVQDIATVLGIAPAAALNELQALQKVAKNNGTEACLVSDTANGNWRAAGV